LISGDDSQTGNIVEIRASGTIEVTEGASDEEEEEDEGEESCIIQTMNLIGGER
jgi:hypothetical protein